MRAHFAAHLQLCKRSQYHNLPWIVNAPDHTQRCTETSTYLFPPPYTQHSVSITSNPRKPGKAWRLVHLSQFPAMLPGAGAQSLRFRKSLHTCASQLMTLFVLSFFDLLSVREDAETADRQVWQPQGEDREGMCLCVCLPTNHWFLSVIFLQVTSHGTNKNTCTFRSLWFHWSLAWVHVSLRQEEPKAPWTNSVNPDPCPWENT